MQHIIQLQKSSEFAIRLGLENITFRFFPSFFSKSIYFVLEKKCITQAAFYMCSFYVILIFSS